MCVCKYSDWSTQYFYKLRVEDKLWRLRTKLIRPRGQKRGKIGKIGLKTKNNLFFFSGGGTKLLSFSKQFLLLKKLAMILAGVFGCFALGIHVVLFI